MIDLHGAVLSQNGLDNSGKRGSVQWGQSNSVALTLKALNKIRDDFASHPAVAAIELLNEPMGPQLDMGMVEQFMKDGAQNLQGAGVAVTFHDAFRSVTSWNNWGTNLDSMMLDTHHYEVFDAGTLRLDINGHVGSACGFGNLLATTTHWTVVGEWSGALTDCAKWLNGRGVGARYDGTYNYNGLSFQYTGSCDGKRTGGVAQLSATDRANLKQFINAQLAAFEKADGWFFWTWKTEGAAEWDFRELANASIIPQPLSSRGKFL